MRTLRSTLVLRAAVALVFASFAGCRKEPLTPDLSPPRGPALFATTGVANEADADAISANIQQLHMPYETLADPGFAASDPASPDYARVVSYNRTGDGAIWTGHYLAAESFRYAVTSSGDALANVRRALNGVQSLVDVTSPAMPGLLARSWVPVASPYLAKIQTDEGHNGLYPSTVNGQAVYWIGNTSRDQYSGIFFGLAVAYDRVADPAIREQAAALVTRMLDYLLAHGWNVVMPGGSASTTFLGRPDQQLALLQIGRHVNPAKYTTAYQSFRASYAAFVGVPVRTECYDTYGSYYKFNLDYINFFDLVRLEEPSSLFRSRYLSAYGVLRNCTATHQNAHFNMVDRVLRGADAARDADTRQFLGLWLTRSRRDYYTDVSSTYPACGINKACSPVPVNDRPNTDFLWQRSPQLLYGGGDGTIETAAVDYLLPYWMARYYGVVGS